MGGISFGVHKKKRNPIRDDRSAFIMHQISDRKSWPEKNHPKSVIDPGKGETGVGWNHHSENVMRLKLAFR